MGAELLVIGIDAATWAIIDRHLDKLKTFKMLKTHKEYKSKVLTLDQKPYSAPCWVSIFSGKTEEEHRHHEFVVDNEIQTRDDIKVDFIWDILKRTGKKVKALNVPFIVPPYNFNINFEAPGLGIPSNREEWDAEIAEVTNRAIETLRNENLDLFVVCYVSLDKLQHFHWGEKIVEEYYEKIDETIDKLISFGKKLIIISDHGFCAFGESKIQTLPRITKDGTELKGDHHENAVLITKNIKTEINNLRDVFKAIKEVF